MIGAMARPDDGQPAGETARFVLVEIHDALYAIDAMATVELLRAGSLSISRLPHAPESAMGVANHRGVVIPVFDLRRVLGLRALEEEISELRGLLEARERDHVEWLEELRRCAETGREFTKATDPHKCAFGRWYDQLRSSREQLNRMTKGDLALRAVIEGFDEPHRRIHGIAERTLTLAREGSIDEARAVINRAWDGDLASMKRLFARLLQLFTEQRQPILVVVSVGDKRVALSVDGVREVAQIDLASIQPAPGRGAGCDVLSGLVMRRDENILVLDLAAVVAAANAPLAA